MGITNTIRRLFSGFRPAVALPSSEFQQSPPAAERIRRWQGSIIDRNNQGHWGRVTGQPINADLSTYLTDIRNRAEDEISKNSLIEGMVSTYELSCLGSRGPTLRIVSDDQEYADNRERVWQWWQNNAASNQQMGLRQIMGLWIRSLFGCGEFVDQKITIPDVDGPVKMRLLPLHSHRLMTPPEFLGDPAVAMGVRRDLANRRPICYYISQPYILGAFEVYTGQFVEVPYRDMLHGFLMKEEDQVRGVPWLAPCLDEIAELRDCIDSMLDCMRASGDWGVYLSTVHPDIAPLQMKNIPSDLPFERRQERYVPPGWTPSSVTPQQPPPNWDAFYHTRVQAIGRCVNMSLMMMLLDSSKHSFASARFDGQLYWRGIDTVQGFLARNLDRLESEVAQEAELAWLAGDKNGIPPAKTDRAIERNWLWPQAPEVDASKERMADRLGLQNGDTTLSEICARKNKDILHVIADRKRENEMLKKAGLPTIPGIPDPNANAGGGSDGFPPGAKAPQRIGSHLVGNGHTTGKNRLAGMFDERTRGETTEIIEIPDIRQPNHFACGCCSAMSVGKHYGVGPKTEKEWEKALGTTEERSTSPNAIVGYLTRLGLHVEAREEMTVSNLAGYVKAGWPVICPVQDYGNVRSKKAAYDYGHWLTVIAVLPGYIVVQDSSEENAEHVPGGDVPKSNADGAGNLSAPGRVLIREEDWIKAWHDKTEDGTLLQQFGIAVGPPQVVSPSSNGHKQGALI